MLHRQVRVAGDTLVVYVLYFYVDLILRKVFELQYCYMFIYRTMCDRLPTTLHTSISRPQQRAPVPSRVGLVHDVTRCEFSRQWLSSPQPKSLYRGTVPVRCWKLRMKGNGIF